MKIIRRAMTSSAVLGALCGLLTAPANAAGHWEAVFNGTIETELWGESPLTNQPSWSIYTVPGHNSLGCISFIAGGYGSANITPKLVWKPNGGNLQNNPAPDSVTVQLIGFSSATTHTEGDTMTVIANGVTDHGHPNFPGDESYRVGDATSKRLLKIDNPDHLTELNLPTTNLSVTTVSAYGDADTTLLVAVLEDTRFVNLTRSNAPTALAENAVVDDVFGPNPDLNKARDEWVESNGTGHGHTLASCWERSMVADDWLDVTNTIAASRSGVWSQESQLQFAWLPGVADNLPTSADTTWRESKIFSETIDGQIRQMIRSDAINNPDGVVLNPDPLDAILHPYIEDSSAAGWLNTPSDKAGGVVDFKYKLTDTDGAVAEAKYFLTLHDVWENPVADPRMPLAANATTANPVGSGVSYEEYYFVPSGSQGSSRGNTNTWEIGQTTTYTVTLEAAFQLGFKIKDWVSASGSAELSRELEITQNMKSGAPSLAVPETGPDPYDFADADTRFKAVVVFNAKRVHKLVNHFGTSGYIPHSATLSPTFERDNTMWGRTPQSKIDLLDTPRADWYPYDSTQGAPTDNSTGTWTKSGGLS